MNHFHEPLRNTEDTNGDRHTIYFSGLNEYIKGFIDKILIEFLVIVSSIVRKKADSIYL